MNEARSVTVRFVIARLTKPDRYHPIFWGSWLTDRRYPLPCLSDWKIDVLTIMEARDYGHGVLPISIFLLSTLRFEVLSFDISLHSKSSLLKNWEFWEWTDLHSKSPRLKSGEFESFFRLPNQAFLVKIGVKRFAFLSDSYMQEVW
jgi:hypothetical protein